MPSASKRGPGHGSVRLPPSPQSCMHAVLCPCRFYSPYSGTDSNAGNPLVISIDDLIQQGLLDGVDAPPRQPVQDVNFAAVRM